MTVEKFGEIRINLKHILPDHDDIFIIATYVKDDSGYIKVKKIFDEKEKKLVLTRKEMECISDYLDIILGY